MFKYFKNIMDCSNSKSEHQHFRNQWTKMDWSQMAIISTTVGKTPLEEME